MLFEKAKLDVWREQAGSKEFHNLKTKIKKKSLFAAVKNSFFKHGRPPQDICADRTRGSGCRSCRTKRRQVNFFAKQAGSMLSKIQNALNPNKEIKISSSSVMAACAESEARTNKFARKLADLAKKATGKRKNVFQKPLMTHKAKEAFARKSQTGLGTAVRIYGKHTRPRPEDCYGYGRNRRFGRGDSPFRTVARDSRYRLWRLQVHPPGSGRL